MEEEAWRVAHEAERQGREEAMDKLRQSVKDSRFTYGDIAHYNQKSNSWVGEVLRGNYPYRGANLLPKWIVSWLERFGFEVPHMLKTFD